MLALENTDSPYIFQTVIPKMNIKLDGRVCRFLDYDIYKIFH